MNLILARQILRSVSAHPDGCLEVHGRKMLHEVRAMKDAGWLELSKAEGTRRGTTSARLTEVGQRVNLLFQDDAVAQRLRDAFMAPRRRDAA